MTKSRIAKGPRRSLENRSNLPRTVGAMTLAEATETYRVSRTKLYLMIQSGELTHAVRKVGTHKVLLSRADMEVWFNGLARGVAA